MPITAPAVTKQRSPRLRSALPSRLAAASAAGRAAAGIPLEEEVWIILATEPVRPLARCAGGTLLPTLPPWSSERVC
ncbi:MAG: hypothetical protein ACRDOA_05665 [Streptosporangiaceae bacterium]